MSVNVHPDDVFSVCPIMSAQYLLNRSTFFLFFFSKLGIVVYYHKIMCQAEKLVQHFQGQGFSEGLYNLNMIVFTICSKLLLHLQTNLVW